MFELGGLAEALQKRAQDDDGMEQGVITPPEAATGNVHLTYAQSLNPSLQAQGMPVTPMRVKKPFRVPGVTNKVNRITRVG